MARPMQTASRILACSVLLLILAGCEVTLGPRTERKLIVVNSGVPVEILQNKVLDCHVLAEKDGEANVCRQDVGGWVAMPPDHWKSLKAEVQRLRKKCGEPE